QYIEAKRLWESCKFPHEQFITLLERTKEIPALEEKIALQRSEIEKAAQALDELERSVKDLGFDPEEYSSLLAERKRLAQAEEEANKIKIRLALEPEVKEKLAAALNVFLEPTRERRARYEAQTGYVDELIYTGTLRAREEGKQTLSAVKKAMGLAGAWNRISRAAEKRVKKQEIVGVRE
ncbi:MAG TPA: hypothetical protein PL187_22595, partial [Caldilinea sp.]|nr:hypothetical protein [Caldilinea sp.]